MSRLLSYSEISTALTCWARHDFAYVGRLAGSTLKPKELAPILSAGRAWGAAAAAYHGGDGLLAAWQAHEALRSSLDADEWDQDGQGVMVDHTARTELEARLKAMLAHYVASVEPLPNLTRLEDTIEVPIPSRGGKHRSTAYRFLCRIDGWTVDDHGRAWLVEFKLRRRLESAAQIQLSRQLRWYAWALEQSTGVHPVGVLVEERLNEPPKPPRVLASGRLSHAKDQLTTVEWYELTCEQFEEEPRTHTSDALRARQWQQRVPIMFRPSELEEAGQELVSAAKLIRDLDSGELAPIRNASRMNCSGCRFREICAEPGDELYVESLYKRTIPKRDREELHEARNDQAA